MPEGQDQTQQENTGPQAEAEDKPQAEAETNVEQDDQAGEEQAES